MLMDAVLVSMPSITPTLLRKRGKKRGRSPANKGKKSKSVERKRDKDERGRVHGENAEEMRDGEMRREAAEREELRSLPVHFPIIIFIFFHYCFMYFF